MGELQNASKVKAWIQDHLEAVQTQFADGLNIDIEGATQNGTNQSAWLAQLVEDTSYAFKMANKDYQVTFDVAWSPNCIDGRCYNYTSIAAATDFVVIMAYDERSQIFGACTASANSALLTTVTGVEDYISLGISPDKLVLGLPWYGYDYPCLSLTDDSICTIPKVPFRGASCSDAAGAQRPYTIIRDLIRSATAFVQWNASLETPFFNYKTSGGEQHQVWFDNTESLSVKYTYAAQRRLKGLAIWNIDSVNYSGSKHDDFLTDEMWDAISVFFEV
jgi:di-N-acetylchitobiase